ncbi:MAG: Holliday junction branch migration protein RuvA [Lachnospiraceae bacterium]|nr:Holliday junction branch migration protein RuvA [Lachnospiraceae bacterium]
MISFIRGELAEITESSVVIDCGGVGYEMLVPGQVFENLPRIGNEVKLYTYLQVREDGVSLYGFLDRDELAVFRLLIGVSGIGPKGAVGILSALSTNDLRFAVLAEDEKTIAKAPGIGAKTAKKLILELKDKFRLEDAFERKLMQAENLVSENGEDDFRQAVLETIQALEALGFPPAQAKRMVNSVEGAEGMSPDELLKAALKKA